MRPHRVAQALAELLGQLASVAVARDLARRATGAVGVPA